MLRARGKTKRRSAAREHSKNRQEDLSHRCTVRCKWQFEMPADYGAIGRPETGFA